MKFSTPDGIIDTDNYDLFIFSDFDCITNVPFKDQAPLAVQPGRAELLAELATDRVNRGGILHYAMAANKGGVARGLHTEEQARSEVEWTAAQINAEFWEVCFGLENPAPGYERYAATEILAFRKPQPGMLLRLMERADVDRRRTLMIGPRSEDRFAAERARCAFLWARRFFADAHRYVPPVQAVEIDSFDPFLDAEDL